MSETRTCWFTKEQWEKLRLHADDPDIRDTSYEKWRAMTLESIRVFTEQGMRVRRIDVNAGDFVAWCRQHRARVDGAGLCLYSAWKGESMPDDAMLISARKPGTG